MNSPLPTEADALVFFGATGDPTRITVDEEMLRAYFGGDPAAGDRGRMVIYKAMCDLLWTLWGLIQLANGNPADDFRAYAEGRFARCKALMASPDFARHLAAVAA